MAPREFRGGYAQSRDEILVSNLLEKGAAVTIGPVAGPYISDFPSLPNSSGFWFRKVHGCGMLCQDADVLQLAVYSSGRPALQSLRKKSQAGRITNSSQPEGRTKIAVDDQVS